MDIVEEIRKNPEIGAKRLVSEYKTGLLALACRFCNDVSDAEELVNRTFAEVVASIESYAEQAAFFGWMCQILTNLHANDCRRKANANISYPGDVPDVADLKAQNLIFSKLDHEFLRQSIQQLPSDIRKAVVLHYFEEMPIREVARLLNTPAGTIAWRLHCAREILSAKLNAKVRAAAKNPVVKALLVAVVFCAVVALGAVGVSAIRSAATASASADASAAETQSQSFAAPDNQCNGPIAQSAPIPEANPSNGSQTANDNDEAVDEPAEVSIQQEQAMNKTMRTSILAAAATASAALSAVPTAQAETVCYFNGSTYIDMGKGFPLKDSVSLSAWVCVDPLITTRKPTGSNVYGAGIVGQGYWGGETGLGFFAKSVDSADTSKHGIQWQVRNASGTVAAANYLDPAIYTAQAWHHYLVVRDKTAGKARFYVDGALCGEEKSFDSSINLTPTKNFAIGKSMSNVGGCFSGWIAEVAIWNVALTADDAALLPKVGPQGISGKVPYAYFPLNEGSGNSVTGTDNGASLTRSATGTLSWTNDASFRRINVDDVLSVSSSPSDCGSPSPSGYTIGLAAGATVAASCGAMPWTNATETIVYSCAGWKLYNDGGSVVSNGTGTSFTYTHPTPAAYRNLEWQWMPSEVKGAVTAGANGAVSPSGAAFYPAGAPVTVTATPNDGYVFFRWTGTLPDGIDATSASVRFKPVSTFDMTASFRRLVDYYVATNGSDSAAGTAEAPFLTISKAIGSADAAVALEGGAAIATIHVADGHYTLSGQNMITNAITVIGNPASPGSVVLDNSGHRAFYLNNVAAAVKGVTITGTGANVVDTQGGHVWMTSGLLEDCIVENGGMSNGTGYNGGNVRIGGTSTLRRCIIRNGTTGTAYKNGGNVFAVGGVIENCLIAGGKCTGGEASGVWTYDQAVTKIVNCTFIGNYGGKPAVLCNNSASRVVNCAFYNNGGTPTLEWGNKNAACFVNCAVPATAADGFTGSGCIATLTPAAFKDYANADYMPAKGGVLVDAGTKWADYIGAGALSETDLAGSQRCCGGRLDIGSYELFFVSGFLLIVH